MTDTNKRKNDDPGQGEEEVLRKFKNDGTSIPTDQTVLRKGNLIGGYLLMWGDPDHTDMDGEYFTADTEFVLPTGAPINENIPVIVDGVRGGLKIGELSKAIPDGNGLIVEGQLWFDRHHPGLLTEEQQHLMLRLIDEGKLSFASAAFDPETDEHGKIKRWPLVSASFTPTPDRPAPINQDEITDADANDQEQ